MGLLGTYINFTSASSTELVATVQNLFTDLWLLIVLVAGIPFGIYLIRKLVSLVPKR